MPRELGLSPRGDNHSAANQSLAFMKDRSLAWPRDPVAHK
jgi:hypothetical protein